jgi:hypothetical protein
MAVRVLSPPEPPSSPPCDEAHLTRLLRRAELYRHVGVYLLAPGVHPYGSAVEVRRGLYGRACRMELPQSVLWHDRSCTCVVVGLRDLRVYLGHVLLGVP